MRSSNSVGFTSRSASRIPDDSNWNTPVESPRASIAYVSGSSSGSVAMSSPPDEGDRLVDHVEVAEPEEVHLQEAEVHDVVHPDLRHDLLVGALLLERDHLDQRLRTDDDAGRVDGVRPRQPLERSREVDDLLRDRVRVDGLAQLGAGLERVLEHLPRPFRDHLREAVDDAVRDVEHAPGIADRGAGGHRREGDDLRDAVAAVLLGDVVDDAVAARDGEVDVHVRQVLARRVQEPLEEQPVAHRIDVGDLEAVGGERAGGRAAARARRSRRSSSRSG